MTVNRLFRWAIALLAVAALLIGLTYAWAWHWYRSAQPFSTPTRVVIEAGDGAARVASRLAEAGVVDRPNVFRWLIWLDGKAGLIRRGEFEFESGSTPEHVIAKLIAGDVVFHRIALIEGHTLDQTLARMRTTPALIATTLTPDEIAVQLGVTYGNPEGLFFPDTYSFERGTTDFDILTQAYDRMLQILEDQWQARAPGLPLDDPYQALILASLVEKETGTAEDRAMIAQVFVDRLKKRMRLQTDPSVIYGVGAEFDGNLTRAHLRSDTPYNTYTRHGLPPTPIALVGLPSIVAALHPAATDYLYFVAKGDGSSQFSRTLPEHQSAVRRYQLGGRSK